MSASANDTWIIDHLRFVIENAVNGDEAFRCERHAIGRWRWSTGRQIVFSECCSTYHYGIGYGLPNPERMAHECGVALAAMKEHYFDDLKTGDRFQSEPLNVSEKQLIEFAHKFDPQMFHLSRKRAERTIFKGLIASGWHTAAMTMRLFVQTLNFAEGAIGLGVDELRWPNVVRPGDVLTVETEIVDARPSRSRPGFGIIRLRNVTTNQRGQIVQTMLASAMVPRRKH